MSAYHERNKSSGDQSTVSFSTEAMVDALAGLKLAADLEKLVETDPAAALSRMLSQRTATSTESSFAERMRAAREFYARQNFKKIGAGTCGRVYQETGTLNVLKRANTEDYAKQLWNDYLFHTSVCEGFEAVHGMGIDIHVPKVFYYIGKDDDKWWAINENRFPESDKYAPYAILVTERILPLMKPIRKSLAKLYCKPNLQDQVLKDPNNADCLARVYLGSRRAQPVRKLAFFTLRNFKLHVDMLEELEVDAEPYAVLMAQALAVMHWKIGCDARDVEFVLGSAPVGSEGNHRMTRAALSKCERGTSTREKVLDFKHRAAHLWLLDFNQVKAITMDMAGVKLAVKAFMDNDPYFPRPLATSSADQKLWLSFRYAYLAMSHRLRRYQEVDGHVEVSWKGLPETFVDGVVEAERARLVEKAKAAETL